MRAIASVTALALLGIASAALATDADAIWFGGPIITADNATAAR